MALGGGARRVIDEVPQDGLANGVAVQGDQGNLFKMTGPEFIMRMVVRAFPVNEEQEVLRADLDSFAFAPRTNERCELVLGRFDDMLE